MQDIKLENIMFLDIETVPAAESFDGLNERMQKLWDSRSAYLRKDGEDAAEVWGRAGLFAEFGRIVCISAGIFSNTSEPRRFRIKSFYGDDEKILLKEFADLLNKHYRGSRCH